MRPNLRRRNRQYRGFANRRDLIHNQLIFKHYYRPAFFATAGCGTARPIATCFGATKLEISEALLISRGKMPFAALIGLCILVISDATVTAESVRSREALV
jgi:hypothetical protein